MRYNQARAGGTAGRAAGLRWSACVDRRWRCASPPWRGLAIVLTLSACAVQPPAPPAPPAPRCRTPANAALNAELLFGLSIPGGGAVSEVEFDDFVRTELSTRFPAGLTVLPGAGRWRAPDGTMVAEGARVVIVIAPDTAETAARLDAARRAYRERFHQRAVGLITVQSCAAF